MFKDLKASDVDILTIGQYLRPTSKHLPVVRYYHPSEFEDLRTSALAMGFQHVESGPLVRSSYHAEEQVDRLDDKDGFKPVPTDDVITLVD